MVHIRVGSLVIAALVMGVALVEDAVSEGASVLVWAGVVLTAEVLAFREEGLTSERVSR